jgi:hypothetical protein
VIALGVATGIDHVGVVVRDLAAASAACVAAGFAPSGEGGRLIMLRHGYIELLADDPARPSATLARMLAQGEGPHVLSLRVADAAAATTRLARAGFTADLLRSERPSEPGGPAARFRRVPLTDADPRLQLIEHETPEVVWQERWLAHPNGAAGIESVTLRTADPAAMAARLSRAAGRPVQPDPEGGYVLRLGRERVRVLPGEGAARITEVALGGSKGRLLF